VPSGGAIGEQIKVIDRTCKALLAQKPALKAAVNVCPIIALRQAIYHDSGSSDWEPAEWAIV
jgi:hypothetical protein